MAAALVRKLASAFPQREGFGGDKNGTHEGVNGSTKSGEGGAGDRVVGAKALCQRLLGCDLLAFSVSNWGSDPLAGMSCT